MKDGGQAFPCGTDFLPNSEVPLGMTLRDYFAGQALVGLIARLKIDKVTKLTAECSFDIADAMIKAKEAK